MRNPIRKTASLLSILCTLTSCHTSMYPLISNFTAWSDESGYITINCQFSHEGGNGSVLVNGQQESFIWQFGGDNYIDKYWPDVSAYIPRLDMDFYFEIQEIAGSGFKLLESRNDKANIQIKYDEDVGAFDWEETAVEKIDFDDTNLDFKNYLSSKIVCENLGLEFNNTLEAQKGGEGLENSFSGDYDDLHLFLLDDCEFAMKMGDLMSSGKYATSKTQVVFHFENDSIFNLENNEIIFELAKYEID